MKHSFQKKKLCKFLVRKQISIYVSMKITFYFSTEILQSKSLTVKNL